MCEHGFSHSTRICPLCLMELGNKNGSKQMTPEIRKAAEEYAQRRPPTSEGDFIAGAQFGYALAIQRLRSDKFKRHESYGMFFKHRDVGNIVADWLEQQEGK